MLKRHPIKTVLLLAVLFFALAEGSVRVVFAIKDYPVGTLAPAWLAFKQVDSLEVWQSFYMDSNGIYKANPEYWRHQPAWNVNAEGFRGRAFVPDTLNDTALTVLFIGDSYTWGAHAKPPDSCFVDLIDRQQPFVCYNAGIPGTDPAQYLQVAKVYLPRLHPRFTVVILFLGNDLMETPRIITPYENIYYQTSAGWLPVNYQGHHFATAQESYNFIKDKFLPSSALQHLLLKTAAGTAVLSLPLRLKELSHWKKLKSSSVTRAYLQQIQAVCRQHDSRLLIFLIPADADLQDEFYQDPMGYINSRYAAVIDRVKDVIRVLPFRKAHLYPLPDGHLNNAGHAFAAEIIKKEIVGIATTPSASP